MKKLILSLLVIVLANGHLFAQTTPRSGVTHRKASAAAHGAFDATAISMVLWGTGMAIIFAAAAAIIPNSGGSSHFHSHGG